jgi:F-type H+-transporting ATPase subunit delta
MASAAARRHARAAFQIALERNELDICRGDLERLSKAVEDPLLFAFLENPKVHFENKAKVLRQGFAGVNPMVINLALLLVSRGRLNIITNVAKEYERMVDEKKGIAHADVVTAVSLSSDDENKLARRLGDIVGSKVVVSTGVSPEIIGGLVIKVGDKLIDGSTKSQFRALKKSMGGSVK